MNYEIVFYFSSPLSFYTTECWHSYTQNTGTTQKHIVGALSVAFQHCHWIWQPANHSAYETVQFGISFITVSSFEVFRREILVKVKSKWFIVAFWSEANRNESRSIHCRWRRFYQRLCRRLHSESRNTNRNEWFRRLLGPQTSRVIIWFISFSIVFCLQFTSQYCAIRVSVFLVFLMQLRFKSTHNDFQLFFA